MVKRGVCSLANESLLNLKKLKPVAGSKGVSLEAEFFCSFAEIVQ
jgi:hypothetical protein